MILSARPTVLVIEHEPTVDIGLVGERLAAAGIVLETVGPARGRAIPDDLGRADGLLVLGGRMDPDDDAAAPWLPAVRRLLGDAIRRQRPTLAICLGAQLLGMVAGGRVRPVPGGPEIGLVPVVPAPVAAADPVLRHLVPEGRRALEWHWWEVTDLPQTCAGQPVTVLARTERCPVQAFTVGGRVWGVQFHLEALGRTAQLWARSGPERLTALGIDPERLAADVVAAEPELVLSWSPVVDAWGEVVHADASARCAG